MNIEPISSNTFKGYDARPLRGFLMNSNHNGIADEMYKIGKKEGFKIYSPFGGYFQNKCAETLPPKNKRCCELWAQDYWTIIKDKFLTFRMDDAEKSILSFFKLKEDFTQKIARETPRFKELNNIMWNIFTDASTLNADSSSQKFLKTRNELEKLYHSAHIPGGNIYIVQDGSSETAFVGKKELKKYDIEEIKSIYYVDTVVPLPQMDYHIDLFIRPLDNRRILLADDGLSLNSLKKGLQNIKKYMSYASEEEKQELSKVYSNIKKAMDEFAYCIKYKNSNPQLDEIEEILEDNYFDVIRVPGRVYDTERNNAVLNHKCNYINANVLKNNNGDLVYITNKSNIDKEFGLTPTLSAKIGYSFENEFIKSILPYIKKEHIYFVDGENHFISETMLSEYQGGIHCVCSEVPM